MACNARVAAPGTKLGLPELQVRAGSAADPFPAAAWLSNALGDARQQEASIKLSCMQCAHMSDPTHAANDRRVVDRCSSSRSECPSC